jgi:hypothetical protein
MLLMEKRGPKLKRKPSRARDLLLYVAISVAVVVLIMVCAHIGINGDKLFRWVGFAAFSLLVFGYFVYGSRPLYEKWTFWALTAAALCVHMVIFVVLILSVSDWKLLWNSVMLVEIPVLEFFRDRIYPK